MDALTDPSLEAASNAFRTHLTRPQYGPPALGYPATPALPYPGLVKPDHQASQTNGHESHVGSNDHLQSGLADLSSTKHGNIMDFAPQPQTHLQTDRELSPSISGSSDRAKRKSDASDVPNNPRKKPKVSQACDRCRVNKMRCGRDVTSSEDDCGNCKKAKTACVYARTPRKRGPIRGHVKELNDRVKELEARVKIQEDRPDVRSIPGSEDFSDLQNLSYFGSPVGRDPSYALPTSVIPNLIPADQPSIPKSLAGPMPTFNAGHTHATFPALDIGNPQTTVQRAIQATEKVLEMLKAAAAQELAAGGVVSGAGGGAGAGALASAAPTSPEHSLQHLAELAVANDGSTDPQQTLSMMNGELQAIKDGVIVSLRNGAGKGHAGAS